MQDFSRVESFSVLFDDQETSNLISSRFSESVGGRVGDVLQNDDL